MYSMVILENVIILLDYLAHHIRQFILQLHWIIHNSENFTWVKLLKWLILDYFKAIYNYPLLTMSICIFYISNQIVSTCTRTNNHKVIAEWTLPFWDLRFSILQFTIGVYIEAFFFQVLQQLLVVAWANIFIVPDDFTFIVLRCWWIRLDIIIMENGSTLWRIKGSLRLFLHRKIVKLKLWGSPLIFG